MIRSHIQLLGAALLVFEPNFAAAKDRPVQNRPVRIGLDNPNLDACGSNGRVFGLNPRGDTYLAVRSAPSRTAKQIDKLISGDDVYVCELTGDKLWYGIVYVADRRTSDDCAVTAPVNRPRAYRGRCKSGWVAAKYINIIAG